MRAKRHDRHGRTARADNDRRHRPPDGFRAAHRDRFCDLVRDALTDLPRTLAKAAAEFEIAIEDVPEVNERVLAGLEVPLVHVREQAGVPCLVVYRRPLELRGTTKLEVIKTTRTAIGEEVARYLDIDPDNLDNLYDDDS
jgi:predicted Zn-dependent protease with MMP-like domain